MIRGDKIRITMEENDNLSKAVWHGNCEEELPKKPVGQLSADSRPTVYQQLTNRLPTG